MNIICMSAGIIDARRPKQGVLDIARAGFENMVLDYGEYYRASIAKNALLGEEMEHSFGQFIGLCGKQNMQLPVAFVPDFNEELGLMHKKYRLQFEDVIVNTIQCIESSSRYGCEYIVIKPVLSDSNIKLPYQEKLQCFNDTNMAYYMYMGQIARECGVKILLTNECYNLNGHYVRGIWCDSDKLAWWVDTLNDAVGGEVFGLCIDAGVCNLCGQNMREFIVPLGKRVKAVIVRDCDGQNADSLLPFTEASKGRSVTDWLGFIRGLREIGFDGQIIIDFEDTAKAFSPMLKPALMQLAYSVADYFRWQIDIENVLKRHKNIVLFGAGNMCRNYMKCYGEMYPPLFTCDNNSAVWGTSFCGLDVKSPEELKNIPKDCVILICNIYYREIEEQLRNMEITNPIEFFNDEYMPDFHFFRIEDVGGKK